MSVRLISLILASLIALSARAGISHPDRGSDGAHAITGKESREERCPASVEPGGSAASAAFDAACDRRSPSLRVAFGGAPDVVAGLNRSYAMLFDPLLAGRPAERDAAPGPGGKYRLAAERVGRITGQPLPRFVSLKSSQVNLRTGPGTQYPVDWVFLRPSMPVEVLDEFDVWRKIRDSEGTEGWVHKTFLSGRRSILVTGATRQVKGSNREDAETVAMAEPGVIGRLTECRDAWCRIEIAGTRGWLKRSEFWGVYEDEQVK